MPQTDRQTDKATWWSVTAFKDDEMAQMESPASYPTWLKKVYGGREECPDTKKIHFQGALQCRTQVRMSQIKSWLPTAHLEVARSTEALKKYAMKEETAVGSKQVLEGTNYWSLERIMCEIGKRTSLYQQILDPLDRLWTAVNCILAEDPSRAATLANPTIERFWKKTYETWENEYVRALVLQPEQAEDRDPLIVELNSPDSV